jgi:hypothetical protein
MAAENGNIINKGLALDYAAGGFNFLIRQQPNQTSDPMCDRFESHLTFIQNLVSQTNP